MVVWLAGIHVTLQVVVVEFSSSGSLTQTLFQFPCLVWVNPSAVTLTNCNVTLVTADYTGIGDNQP